MNMDDKNKNTTKLKRTCSKTKKSTPQNTKRVKAIEPDSNVEKLSISNHLKSGIPFSLGTSDEDSSDSLDNPFLINSRRKNIKQNSFTSNQNKIEPDRTECQLKESVPTGSAQVTNVKLYPVDSIYDGLDYEFNSEMDYFAESQQYTQNTSQVVDLKQIKSDSEGKSLLTLNTQKIQHAIQPFKKYTQNNKLKYKRHNPDKKKNSNFNLDVKLKSSCYVQLIPLTDREIHSWSSDCSSVHSNKKQKFTKKRNSKTKNSALNVIDEKCKPTSCKQRCNQNKFHNSKTSSKLSSTGKIGNGKGIKKDSDHTNSSNQLKSSNGDTNSVNKIKCDKINRKMTSHLGHFTSSMSSGKRKNECYSGNSKKKLKTVQHKSGNKSVIGCKDIGVEADSFCNELKFENKNKKDVCTEDSESEQKSKCKKQFKEVNGIKNARTSSSKKELNFGTDFSKEHYKRRLFEESISEKKPAYAPFCQLEKEGVECNLMDKNLNIKGKKDHNISNRNFLQLSVQLEDYRVRRPPAASESSVQPYKDHCVPRLSESKTLQNSASDEEITSPVSSSDKQTPSVTSVYSSTSSVIKEPKSKFSSPYQSANATSTPDNAITTREVSISPVKITTPPRNSSSAVSVDLLEGSEVSDQIIHESSVPVKSNTSQPEKNDILQACKMRLRELRRSRLSENIALKKSKSGEVKMLPSPVINGANSCEYVHNSSPASVEGTFQLLNTLQNSNTSVSSETFTEKEDSISSDKTVPPPHRSSVDTTLTTDSFRESEVFDEMSVDSSLPLNNNGNPSTTNSSFYDDNLIDTISLFADTIISTSVNIHKKDSKSNPFQTSFKKPERIVNKTPLVQRKTIISFEGTSPKTSNAKGGLEKVLIDGNSHRGEIDISHREKIDDMDRVGDTSNRNNLSERQKNQNVDSGCKKKNMPVQYNGENRRDQRDSLSSGSDLDVPNVPVERMPSSNDNDSKSILKGFCFKYLRTSFCVYKERCRFLHQFPKVLNTRGAEKPSQPEIRNLHNFLVTISSPPEIFIKSIAKYLGDYNEVSELLHLALRLKLNCTQQFIGNWHAIVTNLASCMPCKTWTEKMLAAICKLLQHLTIESHAEHKVVDILVKMIVTPFQEFINLWKPITCLLQIPGYRIPLFLVKTFLNQIILEKPSKFLIEEVCYNFIKEKRANMRELKQVNAPLVQNFQELLLSHKLLSYATQLKAMQSLYDDRCSNNEIDDPGFMEQRHSKYQQKEIFLNENNIHSISENKNLEFNVTDKLKNSLPDSFITSRTEPNLVPVGIHCEPMMFPTTEEQTPNSETKCSKIVENNDLRLKLEKNKRLQLPTTGLCPQTITSAGSVENKSGSLSSIASTLSRKSNSSLNKTAYLKSSQAQPMFFKTSNTHKYTSNTGGHSSFEYEMPRSQNQEHKVDKSHSIPTSVNSQAQSLISSFNACENTSDENVEYTSNSGGGVSSIECEISIPQNKDNNVDRLQKKPSYHNSQTQSTVSKSFNTYEEPKKTELPKQMSNTSPRKEVAQLQAKSDNATNSEFDKDSDLLDLELYNNVINWSNILQIIAKWVEHDGFMVTIRNTIFCFISSDKNKMISKLQFFTNYILGDLHLKNKPSVKKMFSYIKFNVILKAVQQERWEDAFCAFQNCVIEHEFLSTTVYNGNVCSQAEKILLCVEVCLRVQEFNVAKDLITRYQLLYPQREEWSVESKEDDLSVRNCLLRLLLDSMAQHTDNNNLALYFFQEIISVQKSLTNPINVFECYNALQKRAFEISVNEGLSFFQNVRSNCNLIPSMCNSNYRSVLVATVIEDGYEAAEYLCQKGFVLNIYPKLKKKSVIIKSNWTKEEMLAFLSFYLVQRSKKWDKNSTPNPELSIHIEVEKPRDDIPHFLNTDYSLRAAKKRLLAILEETQPKLLTDKNSLSPYTSVVEIKSASLVEYLTFLSLSRSKENEVMSRRKLSTE